MTIEPDDPTEGEKARTRWQELEALYPRARAKEMVKAYIAALPLDDAVILPETSAEQLEAEMAGMDDGLEDAPPEALAELEAMKQLFRDVRGKRPSELPPPTPEELDEEAERETEHAIAQLTSGWISMLHLARRRAGGAEVVLSDDLLDAFRGGTHWLEAQCNSSMLSPDQARELQAAWASNLKPLIDAAPGGYALWNDEFMIKKDARGYVLLASAAP